MIARRALSALLTTPALAQGRVRRIGVLMAGTEHDPDSQARMAAFTGALAGLGWPEGRQLRIERRWAAGQDVLFRTHAGELVGLSPDLLLADGTPSVAALRRETATIPIVFVRVGDPVGSGFVASLARPGGNVTGFTAFDPQIGPKWPELLLEAAPATRRALLLYNPATAPHVEAQFLTPILAAAQRLGITVQELRVGNGADIERGLLGAGGAPAAGLVAMPDTFLVDHRATILDMTQRLRLPAIYTNRLFVSEGGLMSLGFPVLDAYRQAGAYADRILRGARAMDLPVQTPTNWQFAIHATTAAALGLSLSASLLARADEVIE